MSIAKKCVPLHQIKEIINVIPVDYVPDKQWRFTAFDSEITVPRFT